MSAPTNAETEQKSEIGGEMSDTPRTPSPYETSMRLGNEVDSLRKQLTTAQLERDTARTELHVVEEDLRKESELLATAHARIKELEDKLADVRISLHCITKRGSHTFTSEQMDLQLMKLSAQCIKEAK